MNFNKNIGITFISKLDLVSNWRGIKLLNLKKIGTKLNKDNEYQDQIEYKN